MSLCFITPRLPPAVDGLGDYCFQLWTNWQHDKTPWLKRPWTFLVTEGSVQSRALWNEVAIAEFEKSARGLHETLERIDASLVVLQYVGYGYDPYGCPLWLPEALRNWKRHTSSRYLVVMFHETWASGKPWQRVFWLKPRQKSCVKELLGLASAVVTSNMATGRDLASFFSGKAIQIIPIGSSFAPQKMQAKNWRQLLIFGKEASRLRALQKHKSLLEQLAKLKILETVVLAGEMQTNHDEALKQVSCLAGGVKAMTAYNLNSKNLPDSVTTSGLSLMYTESTCLLKSTALHLAAQLGQVPITLQEDDPGLPLERNKHYLSYRPHHLDGLSNKLQEPQLLAVIANNVHELSQTCLSWPEIVNSWENLLRSLAVEGEERR